MISAMCRPRLAGSDFISLYRLVISLAHYLVLRNTALPPPLFALALRRRPDAASY